MARGQTHHGVSPVSGQFVGRLALLTRDHRRALSGAPATRSWGSRGEQRGGVGLRTNASLSLPSTCKGAGPVLPGATWYSLTVQAKFHLICSALIGPRQGWSGGACGSTTVKP